MIRLAPRLLAGGLFSLFLGGCAALPAPDGAPHATNCRAFFEQLDQAVTQADVRDAQSAPIPGYPYLRSNRFLESYRDTPLSPSQADAWLDRLQILDQQARRVELANLPERVRQALASQHPKAGGDLNATVRQCGTELRGTDATATAQAVGRVMQTPAEYEPWMRLAGLYYLSAWPIKSGVAKLHDEIHQVYAQPLERLPRRGELLHYAPPSTPALSPETVPAIMRRASDNPLAIPEPNDADRETLFAAFAPSFTVDTLSSNDLIGTPRWSSATEPFPQLDITRPTVYRHISHTRWNGEILLQLNYVIWFPARPAEKALDILAGRLDGLTWRVTLDRDGRPLVYDTMHNCGCYHLFFPTAGVAIRPEPSLLQEPAFAPQQAPELTPGAGAALRLSAVSHFVDRVSAPPSAWPETTRRYQWADYNQLRALPVADGGTRSLFLSDGIVPGTERGERWILWPMGIPHPGEMRQWGHHATAFFGHRHFDDPFIMERSLLKDQ